MRSHCRRGTILFMKGLACGVIFLSLVGNDFTRSFAQVEKDRGEEEPGRDDGKDKNDRHETQFVDPIEYVGPNVDIHILDPRPNQITPITPGSESVPTFKFAYRVNSIASGYAQILGLDTNNRRSLSDNSVQIAEGHYLLCAWSDTNKNDIMTLEPVCPSSAMQDSEVTLGNKASQEYERIDKNTRIFSIQEGLRTLTRRGQYTIKVERNIELSEIRSWIDKSGGETIGFPVIPTKIGSYSIHLEPNEPHSAIFYTTRSVNGIVNALDQDERTKRRIYYIVLMDTLELPEGVTNRYIYTFYIIPLITKSSIVSGPKWYPDSDYLGNLEKLCSPIQGLIKEGVEQLQGGNQ